MLLFPPLHMEETVRLGSRSISFSTN
jgi:hypothetical protein